MQKLMEPIKQMVIDETVRAIAVYGEFHSTHEAFCVAKEECEEAAEELEAINKHMGSAWALIRSDMPCDRQITAIGERAVMLAAEAVQIAAVCAKFKMLLQARCCE